MRYKIIGSLHLNPLVGYEGFESFENVLEKAKQDLTAFEEGGVDAVIIENNYNLPHLINEKKEAVLMMQNIILELKKVTPLPIGISLLWNDYGNAFLMAKNTGAKFIRVPVFVDSVETSFGKIIANPKEVIESRKKFECENVLIYADIQVKHAKMIDERPIAQSAIDAIENGADGVIVTGKWTGKAPILSDLKAVKEVLPKDFPIIVGSGTSKENINELFEFANSVIVSTSLKGEEGDSREFESERNVKPFEIKVNLNKVKDFVEMANQ